MIIAPDADLKVTCRRMISIKALNTGQICVAPDYILVPKDLIESFIDELVKT